MGFIRHLYRNFSILNILLVVASVVVAIGLIFSNSQRGVSYVPPPAKPAPLKEETKTAETPSPSASDYIVVADQNLFHPERRIPPEKKVEKPLPRPEIVLYGTLIMGDLSVAYIEDKKSPITTPGRGKRQTVLKKGDSVGGFVLKGIETDRIVLVRANEVMTVPLLGSDKQRTRESSAPASPRAVVAPPPPRPAPVPPPRPVAPIPAPPAWKPPDQPKVPERPTQAGPNAAPQTASPARKP